jgi:hypothetical protein
MGISQFIMRVPGLLGGADPLANLRSLVDDNGGVLWDFQDASGSVALAYNSALALGRDIVINGGFDADTDWTKGTGWSIAAGVASCDGSQVAFSSLEQTLGTFPSEQGRTYEVTFTISNYSAGAITPLLNSTDFGTSRSANGTYVEDITVSSAVSRFRMRADASFIGDIDNVTVRQTNILASTAYPGAELHTDANAASDPNGNEANATTGWTAAGSTFTSDGTIFDVGSYSLKYISTGNGGRIYKDIGTDFALEIGKQYQLSFVSRHVGSGGNNSLGFGASDSILSTTLKLLTNTDTTFGGTSIVFTHSANTQYFLSRETSATNDGGIYLDNFSCTEANPLNADTTGATVAQPGPAGLLAYSLDGTNDYVDAYSAELNSVFDPTKGTLLVAAKVSGAGVWTDGVVREIIRFDVGDNANFIILRKASSNNALSWFYRAGGVNKTANITQSTTDWFLFALTWNKSLDELKGFVNGAQEGATQSGLGTWVGNFASNDVVIGADGTAPSAVWDGLLTVPVLYRDVLTPAEILQIAKDLGVA